MKKKLTTLAALATLVTVGGVYATWTFAEGNSTAANTTVNVAMTGVNAETEKGTLSVRVMDTNGFTLGVDDSDNDHFAEIKKTGEVTVTFTPSLSASDDIKTNGIDVKCVISYAPYENGPASLTEWKYDGKQIFTIKNDETDPILLNKSAAIYDSATGTFTWKIKAEEIGIDIKNDNDGDAETEDFFIDTLAKYNEMNAILAKGHFVLTVSEYVATQQNG